MRAAERYCAFLSRQQSDFIAQSLTMSSEVFSASMMTIANLDEDIDYTGTKLATKHSIMYILRSIYCMTSFFVNIIDKNISLIQIPI